MHHMSVFIKIFKIIKKIYMVFSFDIRFRHDALVSEHVHLVCSSLRGSSLNSEEIVGLWAAIVWSRLRGAVLFPFEVCLS
jgi:hypothetical protein